MTFTSALRRFSPLVLAGTLVLSACGSSNALSKNDVLSVNGKGYSRKDLNTLIDTLVTTNQLVKNNGKVSGDDMSGILRVLVKWEAYKQFKDEFGLVEKPETIKKVQDAADNDARFADYPKSMQDLLIGLNIAETTLSEGAPPSAQRIQDLYTKSPASAGVLCLSHILVKTEAQARAVLKDLAEGADFAAEAKKKSIEPAAKTSGGALAVDGEPCQTLDNAQTSFDADFVRGAIDAKPGVPSGPVKTQFGWHIILSHPYAKVSASIKNVLGDLPLQHLLNGFMATSDIKIASSYGSWDRATNSVR